MKKRLFVPIFLTALAGICAQEGFSVLAVPQSFLPMGSQSGSFGFGGGFELKFTYRMPFADWLFAQAGTGYIVSQNTITSESLSVIPFYAGAGALFPARSRLAAVLSAGAGYGLGIYSGENGGSLYLRGEAGARFSVNPALTLGLGSVYHWVSSRPDPLIQGLGIGLTLSYSPGASARRSRIEYRDIRVDPVFPVFYSYYDKNPLGSVTIVNNEAGKIDAVKVLFYCKRYMDEAKLAAEIPDMKKGEVKTVPLYALFNTGLLDITESDKAAARIETVYSFQGQDRSAQSQVTLHLYHRNAVVWDDDRKAAAFVTANDPNVIRYSNVVAGTVRQRGGPTVSLDFSIALGMFQALGLSGLNYVVDPASSYAELSRNKLAVDYLKYPAETLGYGSGDCDDLSACYCALLSSVGIPTAFITVPGHIFMAFALDMDPAAAKATFLRPEDFIVVENRVWVPVETTLISAGFLRAWAEGAKQWRDNRESGKAAFIPVREAQAVYPAVGASKARDVAPPSPDAVLRAFADENGRFIRREISDREAKLVAAVKRSGGAPKDVNTLGVLYARYGLLDEARREFQKAAGTGHPAALVNLGNIHFLSRDYRNAAAAYRQVLDKSPKNFHALLGLAKAQFELENMGEVRLLYGELQRLNPDLANKYTYLGGGAGETARAAAAGYRGVTEWSE